ncbi:MAG: FAD-dependent oxidoreductase [Thermogemmata sp.]|jgi:glycine oxidase|uniref:FAD-dependent oxidoreductase n=1 Tax=Thermogemmata fonticola TaxID=2755323 RepID=A0A7V8VGC3_9BACT|nr:FAD-dependent oxidoreductase [Thermogemmata fonticola]MBA2227549.1 FAD-dependent oxidoreductase [Thermogemmata fonticola]MCX8139553.1 FAD-dependent oxidoreductase [Gemmataceae bacterium]
MRGSVDIAVVGGGVIGLSCAYELACRGWRVGVWDRGALGQEASWAGAGIIPPGQVDKAALPWERLRAIGAARFPSLAEELRELTGIDIGYRRCGGIEFLEAEEAAEVTALWSAEGIAFERWEAEECRRREAGVIPPEGMTAWYLPGMAQVRNPWLMRGLIAACERRQVELHPQEEVVGLAGSPPRAQGVLLADGSVQAVERILLAAGAWTDGVLKHLGSVGAGIHPVRGQIVLVRFAPPLSHRILIVGKRYIVPRGDGHYLVGSTEEPEAGFTKANTAGAVAELLDFATRLLPPLHQAELVKCWSGLRPGSRDGWPIIGPLPGWENVWMAAGHFRAGVQLSPGTARLIAEVWSGQTPCVPLEAVGWHRPFPSGPRAFRS